MRTIEVKLFKFNELSEQAKEMALRKLSDINVDHEWWDITLYDAKQVGINITEFDTYRRSIDGKLTMSAPEVADKILKEHGDQTETYKTAKAFLQERDALVEKLSDGIQKDRVAEGNEDEFDEQADELEEEFRKDILGDYLRILDREYEYLISEEAIIETILANEYEFTEDGKLH